METRIIKNTAPGVILKKDSTGKVIKVCRVGKNVLFKTLTFLKNTLKVISYSIMVSITLYMLGLSYYGPKAVKIVEIYKKASKEKKTYIMENILNKGINPFEVIESNVTSDMNIIKKSFRKVSLKNHPDKVKNSLEKMKDINNAMDFLKLKGADDLVRNAMIMPSFVRKVVSEVIKSVDNQQNNKPYSRRRY